MVSWTHRLLVCFHTLTNIITGSRVKFLQSFKEFLLLPEQKEHVISCDPCIIVIIVMNPTSGSVTIINQFPSILYLGAIRLILCMAKVTVCSFLSKVL